MKKNVFMTKYIKFQSDRVAKVAESDNLNQERKLGKFWRWLQCCEKICRYHVFEQLSVVLQKKGGFFSLFSLFIPLGKITETLKLKQIKEFTPELYICETLTKAGMIMKHGAVTNSSFKTAIDVRKPSHTIGLRHLIQFL